jgi:SAM-dependent methyltransferase
MDVTLRATTAGSEDAAVLADALEEFLAARRGNREAPEAVRAAIERGTVQRQAETVTLRLPLSEAALNRIRRNPDSRTLLRLRLEDAERERWQRVAEIARSLDLREGDSAADVGAGEGFFSIRLARAVGPGGRVFAVEIGERAVAALSRRAEAGSLQSLQPVLGAVDDPHLPKESLQAVLIVNAYHEMPSYEAMLARLFDSLKPGGRLVLVEPWSAKRRGEPRADQTKDHLIAPELAEAELLRAGFEIATRRDDFIHFFSNSRPTSPAILPYSNMARCFVSGSFLRNTRRGPTKRASTNTPSPMATFLTSRNDAPS